MKLTRSLWTKLLTVGLGATMALGIGLTASQISAQEVGAASALHMSYNFLDGGSSSNSAYASTNLDTDVSYAADNPGGTSGTTAWQADYANLSMTTATRLGGKLVSTVQTDDATAWANIKTKFTFTPVIEKVEILGVATFGTAGNTTNLYLQSSTTGTTWSTVASTTNKTGTITFDSMSIPANSYLRFGIALTASTTNSGIGFTGIKVYSVVAAKTLSSIAVTTQPTDKTYTAGESFDPTGMVVTATYSDSSTADVTVGCTYTPDPLTAGTTSVTVSYTESSVTKTATVTGLTVTAAKDLSSISITGTPSKTAYYAGESFDPTGITVTANYSDSSSANVTNLASYSPDPLTAGTTSVTVSYTEGATTKTGSVSGLTVSAVVLNSISIKTAATKTSFKLGETFSYAGLVINANYNNGTVEVSTGLDVSGANTSVLGAQTVTVTYEAKTTTYSIDVTNQGVTVGTPATDLFISEYIEGASYNKAIELFNGTGSSVDLSGYSLKLYSNGATTVGQTLALTGTLANNDVYVLAHGSAAADILAVADTTNQTVINFNGDDSVALFKGESQIDLFGDNTTGTDPGASWTVTDYNSNSVATADKTFVRHSSIASPSATSPFLANQWLTYDVGTHSYLGSHTFAGGDVTAQQQATAFANYVMTGIGDSAAGNCSAVYSELDAEYGYMTSDSKTIYDTSSDTLFVNARARMAYLASWVGSQSPAGIDTEANDTKSQSSLIASAVIGIIGLTTIAGFYFVGKKRTASN